MKTFPFRRQPAGKNPDQEYKLQDILQEETWMKKIFIKKAICMKKFRSRKQLEWRNSDPKSNQHEDVLQKTIWSRRQTVWRHSPPAYNLHENILLLKATCMKNFWSRSQRRFLPECNLHDEIPNQKATCVKTSSSTQQLPWRNSNPESNLCEHNILKMYEKLMFSSSRQPAWRCSTPEGNLHEEIQIKKPICMKKFWSRGQHAWRRSTQKVSWMKKFQCRMLQLLSCSGNLHEEIPMPHALKKFRSRRLPVWRLSPPKGNLHEP